MAESCYRPQYLPASFKGVPFVATEVSSNHGRRGAEGEFPFSENTAYADLGRKIRKYGLSGRFQTNSHISEATAFIRACESPGPGVLVHPTRGILASAACTSLRVRDNTETEQGVTYVDAEFVEAVEWPGGLRLGEPLSLAVGALLDASLAQFGADYRLGEIQAYHERTVADIALGFILQVSAGYAAATIADAAKRTRNKVLYDFQQVAPEDTATVGRAIAYGMGLIVSASTPQVAYRTMRELVNSAAQESALLAPASVAENAIYALVRTAGAAYMAQSGLDISGARSSDIRRIASAVDTILEGEMSYGWANHQNAFYLAVAEFRTEVSARFAEKAHQSPGLIQYDFGGATHPLKAAHAIYADAKRHRELEGLNNVGPYGKLGPAIQGLAR